MISYPDTAMKKLFRKIHLWLSVPFGIFITLICFSGAMLVFEKEITEMCRPGLYFVKEVKEQPLPLDSLMKTVVSTLPDSVSVTGVTISSDAKRTYQVSLSKPHRASLYMDQYTGEIKGRSERLPFYNTMFRLHRWMLGSSQGFGKPLVGISTLLLVIILITGILMWLTNKHKPLAKSLTISCTKGWPRFWHDLHVAGGIYATIFLLALALTGLTWSFSWYRTGFYSLFGIETSAGQNGHGRNSHSENGRAELREDGKGTGKEAHAEHRGRGGRGRSQSDTHPNNMATAPSDSTKAIHRQPLASPFAHWQKVYKHLTKTYPGYRQITLSDGSANIVPNGRNSLRSGDRFDFDTKSGRITGSKPYSEQDKSVKVRSAVYAVHVGSWGGMISRILTFLAALLGATLPLTGYYLWIKRLYNKSMHKHSKQ